MVVLHSKRISKEKKWTISKNALYRPYPTSYWRPTEFQLISSNISRRSHWHPADISLTSCWHTSDISLTSCWHPTDIPLTSHWYPADITLTFHWHPSDIQLTSRWHFTDIPLTSHWYPADISLTSRWPVWGSWRRWAPWSPSGRSWRWTCSRSAALSSARPSWGWPGRNGTAPEHNRVAGILEWKYSKTSFSV